MEKSTKIIMIGVLTVASIIIALPFTPVRSSFKGVAGNLAEKALAGLGVDLNGKIMNARMIARVRGNDITGLDIAGLSDSKNGKFHQGTYSGMNGLQSNGSYQSTLINQKQNKGGGGMGDSPLMSSSGKRGSDAGVSSGTGSIVASSPKSVQGGTTTTRKSANGATYSPGNGATHPGLDPSGSTPMGTLPAGNGLSFLLVMSLGYVGWKKKVSLSSRA